MKRIIFVRHGKSSWKHNVPDIERPLKKRGRKDGTLVSEEFKGLNYKVDQVFSSPANRAFSTCKIFMNTLDMDEDNVQIIQDLYDFEGKDVLDFLKAVDNELDTVMIFGHNYAFTNLVNQLGSEYIDNLPTTGMAIIEFDADNWNNLGKGRTLKIVTPKELKD